VWAGCFFSIFFSIFFSFFFLAQNVVETHSLSPWKGKPEQAEAQGIATKRGRVVVAKRRAAELRIVEPTATAKHAVSAFYSTYRIVL
jgi:hypothetical protein